jgi:hypothetical protein
MKILILYVNLSNLRNLKSGLYVNYVTLLLDMMIINYEDGHSNKSNRGFPVVLKSLLNIYSQVIDYCKGISNLI